MRTKIKILLLTATSFLFALNIANAQTCGTSQVTYSGYTSSYLPKWNVTSGCISNSSIFDNGNVGIGTTAPSVKLKVAGDIESNNMIRATSWLAGTGSGYGAEMGVSGSVAYFMGFNRSTSVWGPTVVVGSTVQLRCDGTIHFTVLNGGNVGIGTTSPLAKLHLNNGSVLFDGTAGATPTSGAGTRMMWIPAKRAFRAGAVSSTEWDDGNIGNYSFASGYATKANGDYSSAIGYGTTASGLQSFASGNSTIVSGNSASALGYNLVAQSYSSFVIGSWNLNPGTYSTTSAVATDPVFVIGNGTSPSTRANAVTVLKNGNMLINKTTQLNSLYKLDIDGTMRVNEIVVNLTGADFVFNSNYKLLPLKELELFIKENSHLPEIASAKEMETGDGVKIGEMQTKLLQKIEELTLYMIELDKTVENLAQENKVLKTKLDIK